MKTRYQISKLAVICVICTAVSGAYGASSVRTLGGNGTYSSAASATKAGAVTNTPARASAVRLTPSAAKSVSATPAKAPVKVTTPTSVDATDRAATQRLSLGKYLGGNVSLGNTTTKPSVSNTEIKNIQGDVTNIHTDINKINTNITNISEQVESIQQDVTEIQDVVKDINNGNYITVGDGKINLDFDQLKEDLSELVGTKIDMENRTDGVYWGVNNEPKQPLFTYAEIVNKIDLSDLDDRINNAIDAKIANLATTKYVDDSVNAVDSRITTNTTNIATNAAAIETNANDIAALKSGKQDVLTAGTNITIDNGVISASVSAVDSYDDTILAGRVSQVETNVGALTTDLLNKQNKLTPGTNITISEEGVISATVTAVDNYDDTALSNRVTANETAITGLQSGKQDMLTAGDNITIEEGVISATANATYDDTALSNRVTANETAITGLQSGKQDALTAGTNITIEDGVISAVDTVYNDDAVKASIAANSLAIGANTTAIEELSAASATHITQTELDTKGAELLATAQGVLTASLLTKQDKLTPGENITIEEQDGVLKISAAATGTGYDDKDIKADIAANTANISENQTAIAANANAIKELQEMNISTMPTGTGTYMYDASTQSWQEVIVVPGGNE